MNARDSNVRDSNVRDSNFRDSNFRDSNFRGLAPLPAVVATLWVGGLWTIGFLAAPTLFAQLPDRALAGRLAGALFTNTAYLGFACAVLLLTLEGLRRPRDRVVIGLALAMTALALTGHFGLRPLMAGLERGSAAFGRWHGVSSVLYLGQSLFGLALVWRLAARPHRAAPLA